MSKSVALRRLAKERDLEGIDVSNIVQGGRRARRAAAVAAPINYAAIDQSGSSSDDDDCAEDSAASSSQDQSSGEAEQHDASKGRPRSVPRHQSKVITAHFHVAIIAMTCLRHCRAPHVRSRTRCAH